MCESVYECADVCVYVCAVARVAVVFVFMFVHVIASEPMCESVCVC